MPTTSVNSHRPPLTVGQCATLACMLEVTAPKPGNVHRGADFIDATYIDFMASAVAIGPAMDAAASGISVGASVLAAVQATRDVTRTNTNLGTILLLAPLAKAATAARGAECVQANIAAVLTALDASDSRDVYAAIRLAQPGGLGKVAEADVESEPPADLLVAMRLAADRDLVALQYVSDFDVVLNSVVPWLSELLRAGHSLADAIVAVQLQMLAAHPDSLIARKCGPALAQESADRAAEALSMGQPGELSYLEALADLDFWLRADGHRRNPGTTADLIAAGLFIALWKGIVQPPFNMTTRLPE